MKIVFSKKCLEYGEYHLESPERIIIAYNILKTRGYEFLEPKPASVKDLLRVHTKSYVKKVKEGKIEDIDTPAYPNIYEYARLSAGGAILAAEINGFSLMRPPGHHAGRNGIALNAPTRGFCYFNNLAIAVKKMGLNTLILDIDGHHGNGTQEIFLGDEKITFISLHRYPHYPGTGYKSEKNCLNFPLSAECGNDTYLKTLRKALQMVELNKIELVAVSAGFDTHKNDIASLGLTPDCYREIGKIIGKINKPTFFVLEGGYVGKNLGEDVHELIKGFEESQIR
ncbi:MAG: histone deacetylase [Candidatus Aenigmarchaeota archaeon]|nr:histone deacetylase [Candidatus Aenigmarchaeota archaeon]